MTWDSRAEKSSTLTRAADALHAAENMFFQPFWMHPALAEKKLHFNISNTHTARQNIYNN